MKVRCIDGSWSSNELTTGKEYEVLSEVGCYYQLKINDKGISYQCYVKSRFEVIKEENKMEKTFREVIADIKEGEVWESKTGKKVHLKRDKLFIDFNHEVTISGTVFPLNEVLTLQKKQYTFDEAFKAYEEGKEIESCFSGEKFKVFSWEDIFNTKEIKEKWYINN